MEDTQGGQNAPTCSEAGHTGEYRDLGSHIEYAAGTDIGPNNDNESTSSSDIIITFGGSAVDGCLSDLMPNGQANLSMLAREINSLQQ